MTLAALLTLVQILSNAGTAAVDLVKIVDAVQKRGGSTLTDEEAMIVRAHAQSHMQAIQTVLDPFDAAHDDSVNGG